MRIAVDASNLVSGGGLTHLENFFANLTLPSHGFTEVVTWCAPHVAKRIDMARPGQSFVPVEAFTQSLIQRHRFRYGPMRKAIKGRFDVLFSPGGLTLNADIPQVVMSRNLQPFQPEEIIKGLPSYAGLRLLALRILQGRSFQRADKVIFLNPYVASFIGGRLGIPEARQAIVPHGVADRFRQAAGRCYDTQPVNILYVSTFNEYKHQIEVIEACARLRESRPDIRLSLVGGQSGSYAQRVLARISEANAKRQWISAPGRLAVDEVTALYRNADIFVFASSCENLPNILLEAMAAGLPIACSRTEPMPSVLKDAGVYFEPSDHNDIFTALSRLVADADLRKTVGIRASTYVRKYTWRECVDRTLQVLQEAARATGGNAPCVE